MNRKIFFISVIVFALDQISKAVIAITMKLGQSIPVIKDFFSITYHNNYGAAWGLLKGRTWIIIIGTVLALVLIYRYMYSFKMNKRNIVAFGLITGGIVGNLLDRILQGYVVDFFDFIIFNYEFPIFNVSDMCIVIGVFLLIIAILRGEDRVVKDSSK